MNEKKEEDVFYSKPRKIKITVIEVSSPAGKGVCHCHKAGDIFEPEFERCPGNICAAAWNSIWPQIRVLELGGRHPWDKEEGVTTGCCPDAERPVTFLIEALA
jgi:uncharacterized repeat protein (TIGR04076 family)